MKKLGACYVLSLSSNADLSGLSCSSYLIAPLRCACKRERDIFNVLSRCREGSGSEHIVLKCNALDILAIAFTLTAYVFIMLYIL